MQTAPPYLKSLKVLHFALLMGQTIFALIACYLVFVKEFQPTLADISQELLIAVILIGLVMFIAGNTIFKKKIEPLKDPSIPVSQKLENYRATSIIRWAMLEGAVLLSIIFFLLTGNQQILIVAVVLIILFITTRPRLQKISEHLNITPAEVEN